jgi:hypothetical protein
MFSATAGLVRHLCLYCLNTQELVLLFPERHEHKTVLLQNPRIKKMLSNMKIKMFCVFVPALLFAVITNASEPIDSWDQVAVTKLAKTLSETIEEIFNDPGINKNQASIIKQRKHDAAIVDFGLLREDAKTLSDQLSAGKGYSYTRALFKRILTLRGKIKSHAKDNDVSQSVRDKAEFTASIITELKKFYNL